MGKEIRVKFSFRPPVRPPARTAATAVQDSLFLLPFTRRSFSHPWEGSKPSRMDTNEYHNKV
jgi:hypothetical protein